jgi:ComF family protein
MEGLVQAVEGLLHLFYPKVCCVCHIPLVRGEEGICLKCIELLPRTRFGLQQDNPVKKLFYGRIPIEFGSAFLHFTADGITQQIMHQLKYKGRKDLGNLFGRYFGRELRDYGWSGADCLVPVPLHPSKLRQRGYNQSTLLANGISEGCHIPVEEKLLFRNTYTTSQTKKGRWARWENVGSVFGVHEPEKLQGRHIALIDDVITTGATIEACAQTLIAQGAAKISVLALAHAVH